MGVRVREKVKGSKVTALKVKVTELLE